MTAMRDNVRWVDRYEEPKIPWWAYVIAFGISVVLFLAVVYYYFLHRI